MITLLNIMLRQRSRFNNDDDDDDIDGKQEL